MTGRHPATPAGASTIEGPIGPGRCEPITGRPWVPIARLYSAYFRAGPPPEPARPPPGLGHSLCPSRSRLSSAASRLLACLRRSCTRKLRGLRLDALLVGATAAARRSGFRQSAPAAAPPPFSPTTPRCRGAAATTWFRTSFFTPRGGQREPQSHARPEHLSETPSSLRVFRRVPTRSCRTRVTPIRARIQQACVCADQLLLKSQKKRGGSHVVWRYGYTAGSRALLPAPDSPHSAHSDE